jgi:hypothetical protein
MLRWRKPKQAADWSALSEEQVKAFHVSLNWLWHLFLAVPDKNKPLQVHTVACVVGSGGVLVRSCCFILHEFRFCTRRTQSQIIWKGTARDCICLLIRAHGGNKGTQVEVYCTFNEVRWIYDDVA